MIRAIFLLLIMAGLAGCGPSKPQLNLFIWSEYIDPEVLREFERRFTCRVNVDHFETPEAMAAKLTAGGDGLYDIVITGNSTLPALAKRGMLARLDPQRIPNLQHLDDRFRRLSFDSDGPHGVPYQWGTVGLYVRAEAGAKVDASWGLIFDPARHPGGFLLVDDMRSTIGAALRFQGQSLNTTNRDALLAAGLLLAETKQRSLGFEGGVGARNRVLARGAAVAVCYNNDAVRGMTEDAGTRFVLPKEGGEMWLDLLSIPARAPNRVLAEQFINFILEPRVGAQVARFTRAATPNRAALEFVPAEQRNDPAIYPPAEVLGRLEYALDLGADNRLYDELWTQIKSR